MASMRFLAHLAAALVVGGALAGCITTVPGGTPGATNRTDGGSTPDLSGLGFDLVRKVEVTVNGDTLQAARAADRPAPEIFAKSAFLLSVRGGSVDPSLLSISYTDRAGIPRDRPVRDFATSLAPGQVVRIDDVALDSGAVLRAAGVEVARRDRPVSWWTVEGYPTGVRMEPGSSLSWALAGGVSESMKLTDVQDRNGTASFDEISGSLSADLSGTLDLAYAATPEMLPTGEARPLSWTVSADAVFALLVELTGRNLSASPPETIVGGFEIAPTMAVDASGRLFIREPGTPVRLALDSGTMRTDASAFGWLTGLPPSFAGNFSCAGKAKADRCVPTEFALDNITGTESFGPEVQEIGPASTPPSPEILRPLTALLGEDLRPGDAIAARVHLVAADLPGADPLRAFDLSLELKAVGFERVTVRAGSFDALKVSEIMTTRIEVGPMDDKFEGVTVEERLAEGSMWLMRDTFVPLRVERVQPVDFTRVVDGLVDAVGAGAWAQAGLRELTSENVHLDLDATGSLELTSYNGTTRFAPWMVVTLFNSGAGFAPAAIFGLSTDMREDDCVPSPGYDGQWGTYDDGGCGPGPREPPTPDWTYGTFTRSTAYGPETFTFSPDGRFTWSWYGDSGAGTYSFQRGEIRFNDGSMRSVTWLDDSRLAVNGQTFFRIA